MKPKSFCPPAAQTLSPTTIAFGTALSALTLSDIPVHAAVMGLNVVPMTLGYPNFANIQLINATTAGPGSFFQINTSIGKTLLAGPGGFGWRSAVLSSPITLLQAFFGTLTIGPNNPFSQTFAFRTPNNELGWVRMDLGGASGSITYLAAAWNNTPGQGIFAGTLNPVPEPSSAALAGLAALAAGATYLRQRRRATPARTTT